MKFRKLLRVLRTEFWLYIRLFRDSRTPTISKVMLIAALFYLLSPIDFIPDFIPFAGFLDELIVIPLIFTVATMFIPKNVVEENKHQVKRTKSFFRRDIKEGVIVE
jgi:uncharacterized membrane protein YkvA (DUF1232 family)